MNLKLEHLAGDLFGLPAFSKRVLASEEPLFGVHIPRSAAALEPPADRFDRDERAALVANLTAAHAPFAPHVAVLDSIRALEQPGSAVALATARVGLFGSTLDALYSALHAIRLASALTEEWNQPVVPLLWIDTDASLSQNSHEAWFRSSDFILQRVHLPSVATEASTLPVRDCLAQLLGHETELESALELLTPREGETLAASLTRALLELLGSEGLLVCTPDDLRGDVSHFLSQVVADDPEGALVTTLEQLAAQEFAQAEHEFDSILVQRIEDESVCPLHSGGDGFRYDDEPGSRTSAELAAEIVQDPRGFVPGAALLPLIQDLILPVAIRLAERDSLYSEAALAGLRDSLAAPSVPILPRLSCTLVDASTRDSLAKLELSVREVYACRESVERRADAEDFRGAIEEFRALSRATSESLHRIARPLWEFDPVLRPVARRSAREMRRALEKLCEKAENVLGNREGNFDRHQRRVSSVLLPRGLPQESADSLLSWLAPFGPAWIAALQSELDPFAWEHLVVNFP